MMRATTLAVLATAVLGACSGGSQTGVTDTPALVSVLGVARDAVRSRFEEPAPRVQVTRAALNQINEPVLEAVRESSGQQAIMQRVAVRRDREPGSVDVWRVPGGPVVALRNGILIGTRGLGGDIQSTELTTLVSAVANRGGQGQRVQHIRADDNKLRRVSSACVVQAIARETIEIVEVRHSTTRLRETCAGRQGRFVNDYWIDSNGGTIWKSRQWAGPETGYLTFRRLKL